jgi:NitT/TauT family transport system substrate-binding protein
MRSEARLGRRVMGAGVAATLMLLVAACGSDSNGSSAATTVAATVAPTSAPATTTPAATPTTVAPTTVAPTTTAPVEVAHVKMTTNQGALLVLPQYVAVKKGFFEKNGLDISIVPVTSGPAGVQALLAGDADVMVNAPDFVILAQNQGQDVKFVVGNNVSAVSTLIAGTKWPLPHAASGYPAVMADFKGAKIGVPARGSSLENQLRLMLKDGGLDPDKDVSWIAVGLPATAIPALQAGQVDALMVADPATTSITKKLQIGTAVVDLRKGEGPPELTHFPQGGYAAKQSYIDAHPDVIKRLVASIVEAQDWMQDPANRKELEAITAEWTKADADLVPEMVQANLPTWGAAITKESMDNAVNLMMSNGVITKAPTYEDLVATQYMPAG